MMPLEQMPANFDTSICLQSFAAWPGHIFVTFFLVFLTLLNKCLGKRKNQLLKGPDFDI